jgi:2',3'-cyclic-nucleotide 2'-phosphodiesterase
MRILCMGDVVGKAGRQVVREAVPPLKKEFSVDLTVVNAENAAGGSGLTPRIAKLFYAYGCDVLTLGDHAWDREELVDALEEDPRIIRPANFPEGTPGRGWSVVKTSSGQSVGIINLLGRVFMRYSVDCPFRTLDKILPEIKKETSVVVVDLHAETTSEKVAFGLYADGRVSAVVGSHTHIQTADEKILPKGTAYITDLGMTGPYDSVIGQNKEKIIQRFLTSRPVRFETAKEDPQLHGVIIDVDEKTGRAREIIRIQRRGA